jgi:hypothetical protein
VKGGVEGFGGGCGCVEGVDDVDDPDVTFNGGDEECGEKEGGDEKRGERLGFAFVVGGR